MIHIKNEFIDFNVYPASSVFVDFKKETGLSIEKAIQDPEADQISLIAKVLFIGHKAYCRLKNEKVSVTESQILDSVTINELTEVLNRFMGGDSGSQKKTK